MRRTTGAVCAAALAAAAAVWLLRRRRRVRHTAAHPQHVVVRRVRHCVPYEATSTHVVKDRHAGVPASAMLQANLGADAEFWSGEIAAGRVTLPRGRAAGDALLAGDTLQVTRHIHEQAVIATEAPRVLYEDDGLLVVDKPAGVPTQDDSPGVGWNTCVGLAQAAYDARASAGAGAGAAPTVQLVACHRLDKPVGGVLILAKNVRKKHNLAARRVARQMQSKEGGVSKVYVARVAGAFPPGLTRCDAPLAWSYAEMRALVDEGGGKPASTIFTLIRRGRSTSLVQCEPITGRSHQIRAHLAALGHPIANDRTYLGDLPAAVGPDEPSADELRVFADDGAGSLARALARARVGWCPTCTRRAAALAALSRRAHAADAMHTNAAEASAAEGGACVATGIWLHSLRYALPGLQLSFESPPPRFACEDFDDL